DPKQGWFASANQMNLPADYPVAQRKVGFEWSNAARFLRVNEVLAAKGKLTVADAMALQTDPYDITARRLIAVLAPLETVDPKLAAALALLRGWDHRTSEGSAGAALFEVWTGKHLGRTVVAAATPASVHGVIGNGDLAAVMHLLDHPDATLPAAARDGVLKTSLIAAFDEVAARLGPDPTTWAWGRLHHARLEHALTPLADAATRPLLAAGPTPMGGTSLSPMAASWRPDDFRVVAGASFRMVLDVGAWDNSMAINTPGQSGNPESPHYRDLFPKWVKGEYVPLAYSRKAVEAATETVISLTPAP
ncbi:MAG: penicillin acylase family protein, partial [Phenylobacterium sp.]|nr:penicillin acylase family protein [Phenylobacterium sp.]